jgi:ABC-type phosphate transport system substrate-binding protein
MTRFLLAVSALAIAATPAFAKDQIRITGSGTVYPFTTTVAEAFGKATGKKVSSCSALPLLMTLPISWMLRAP